MPRRKRKYTSLIKPPTSVATVASAKPVDPWPRYLTTKNAAKYFSMQYFVFYRWAQRAIEDGLLHVDKSTKSWTFDREELDRAWAIRAGREAA